MLIIGSFPFIYRISTLCNLDQVLEQVRALHIPEQKLFNTGTLTSYLIVLCGGLWRQYWHSTKTSLITVLDCAGRLELSLVWTMMHSTFITCHSSAFDEQWNCAVHIEYIHGPTDLFTGAKFTYSCVAFRYQSIIYLYQTNGPYQKNIEIIKRRNKSNKSIK